MRKIEEFCVYKIKYAHIFTLAQRLAPAGATTILQSFYCIFIIFIYRCVFPAKNARRISRFGRMRRAQSFKKVNISF